MTAGRAEAARAAHGFAQLLDLVELGERDGGWNQLGDAVATTDGEGLAAMVDHDNLQLAAIIAVDGAGRVGNGDSVLERQAGTGTNLDFIAFGDGDLEA